MNALEQRQRHVAIRTAEKRLDDHETLLCELGADIVKNRVAAAAAVGGERTHRLKLADEQRAYVDGADRDVRRYAVALYDSHRTMTLWQRLRWIAIGR